MRRLLTAVLMAGIAVAGPSVASEMRDGKMIERGATAVAKTERKGKSFQGVLKRLRKNPRATVTDVEYTREWIDARPEATGGDQFQCLSEALYFEARGETVKGQFAVAEVIVNRAKSSLYPDTVCGVISQGTGNGRYRCQFTYKCDGRADDIAERDAYRRVAKVARAVLDGHAGELTDGALYYHTKAVRPGWASRFVKTATIGVHYFYRRPDQRASSE